MKWWEQVAELNNLSTSPSLVAAHFARNGVDIHPTAVVHPTVLFNVKDGPIYIGAGSRICEGVTLSGPLLIGENVLIGKNAQIRGPSTINHNCLIGYSAEVKRAKLGFNVKLGPLSYAADSVLENGVFFGAMVRTSNYRADGGNITVMLDGERVDTGMNKLGCHVGENTFLGIGCKIYPGREVPPDSLFEMDVHIKKNLDPGHYWVKQELGYKPLP